MTLNRSPTTSGFLAATGLAIVAALPTGLTAQSSPEPGQRVVMVTGSTSGLGREVARSLAADGAHVIVHGRSTERGEELVTELNADTPGSARFYRADFASLDDVRALATAVLRDYPRLDALVNNAGVLMRGDERRMTDDGHELSFQVNYLAGFLLTDLLLPRLRESVPARIVNVSSIAAAPLDFDDPMMDQGYSGGRAYGQSKLALVTYTVALAERLRGSGIEVTALHPATYMDTNMVLSAGITPRSSVMDGRDRVLALLDGPVRSGAFYVGGEVTDPPHPQPLDAEARQRLWAISERLTGR